MGENRQEGVCNALAGWPEGVGNALAFWVLENHWQHALGLLPYFLFLTCPLMHLFMHHGHHNHSGGHGQGRPN